MLVERCVSHSEAALDLKALIGSMMKEPSKMGISIGHRDLEGLMLSQKEPEEYPAHRVQEGLS